MLGGDELEVDGVHNGPDLPGTLAGREKIVLDLVANDGQGVAVDQSQVGEEDRHEARAPKNLVNCNLESHILGFLSFDLAVEPVVKVVSRRTVVDESKDREGKETLHVEGSPTDKELWTKQR